MSDLKTVNLNHVLSTRYYQQGMLEKDLWFRVAERDYTELIRAFDFDTLFSSFDRPITLLDVGCGTGKFPTMLCPHLSQNIHVQYDYLDPSQHSLDELQKTLTAPFTPRTALQSTLESLERSCCPSEGYQIIWCLQSLYCIEHDALKTITNQLQALLNPRNGLALIYLAASDAFYHRLYNLYNQAWYPDTRLPYITAEDMTKTFDALHIAYGVKKLHFPHIISCSEPHVLDNYINQCVFDTNAYANLQAHTALTEFLNTFNNGEQYTFPQDVWLIMFGANTDTTMAARRKFRL
ncbi:MAG: hypothetical protein NPIRA02_16960 [Nitrospirales bacterium]|nr:MAG: hypothetical protein NPIRA02_16960 [Nitrospirales bacterium]